MTGGGFEEGGAAGAGGARQQEQPAGAAAGPRGLGGHQLQRVPAFAKWSAYGHHCLPQSWIR